PGAMSLRSLMMMRPCTVSIRIVFCGSEPGGNCCAGSASAGAAHRSAATTAIVRIIEGLLTAGLAGELCFQTGCHRLRHERRHVATHGGDLPDKCGSDRADRR